VPQPSDEPLYTLHINRITATKHSTNDDKRHSMAVKNSTHCHPKIIYHGVL
jgi:hypothetical protein